MATATETSDRLPEPHTFQASRLMDKGQCGQRDDDRGLMTNDSGKAVCGLWVTDPIHGGAMA